MLSDKILNVPELGDEGFLFARPGFNVIGTANCFWRHCPILWLASCIRAAQRFQFLLIPYFHKGVNEMSSALKRRFNFETVMPVREVSMEKQIILNEVTKLAQEGGLEMEADEDVCQNPLLHPHIQRGWR